MKRLLRNSEYCLLLIIFCNVLIVHSASKKSCESTCSNEMSPRCGTWLQEENLDQNKGIYLVDESFVNLTCTFTSLPKPITINWEVKPHHATKTTPVRCSSLKTTTQCSVNKLNEHSVTSTCFLRISKLDQDGLYHCSASDEDGILTKSVESHIQVYGIAQLSADQTQILHYGQIDTIEAVVCAHPKPQVMWLHRDSGEIVVSGGSPGTKMVALDLIPQVIPEGRIPGSLMRQHKCYISRLVVNDILSVRDGYFDIVASNAVHTKKVALNVDIVNLPRPTQSANGLNLRLDMFLFLTLFVFLFG